MRKHFFQLFEHTSDSEIEYEHKSGRQIKLENHNNIQQ